MKFCRITDLVFEESRYQLEQILVGRIQIMQFISKIDRQIFVFWVNFQILGFLFDDGVDFLVFLPSGSCFQDFFFEMDLFKVDDINIAFQLTAQIRCCKKEFICIKPFES